MGGGATCPPELLDVPLVDDTKVIAIEHATAGVWAEFGVYRGNSARYLINHMPDNTVIHLFDSFRGLPEEWDLGNEVSQRFVVDKIPTFNDVRVITHVGMFADTLPADMGVLNLVHIDCDLYQSTVTVLDNIQVEPGTVILFDEYHGYPNYAMHERKAYLEWSQRTNYKLNWLAKGRMQAVGIVYQ